jgi:DNA primase
MARVGQDKIEEVRSRADIVEIIGAHVRLKRAGRNFVGLCPFHNEKTPSFTVSAERGFFHCFGCGAGGTAFDFVMRIEGLTFPEALQSLARRYGITLPERGEGAGVAAGERDAWFLANQTAAEFFAHVLWNTEDGKPARDYLKSRGITTDTARAFMLGFAPARPANLAGTLQKRGLMEAAVKLGLVRRDGANVHDMFRTRVMFPIRDAQGRVIAFGGRVLDDRLPKYMNSTESPVYSKARALYGIYEARQTLARSDRAIVVEGYIDAIALWQAGFKETVASLGTSLTVDQLRLLSRYTRNVIACFDGDDAGRKASLRALEVFLAAGLLGKGAFIPAGFDPDTLVRDRGAQALRELLENAELLVDFFVKEEQRAIAGPRGPVDERRVETARRVADKLRLISDEFQFNLVVRKAAEMLGVGEELLRNYARRGARPAAAQTAASPREVARPARPDAATQAELGLVAIAIRYPTLRAEILASTPLAAFDDNALAAFFEEICRSDETGAQIEIQLQEQLTEEQRARLGEFMVGDMLDDPQKARAVANDYLDALERRRRGQEMDKHRRTAAVTSGDESVAAAQAIVTLRRQSQRTGEGTS